MVDICHQGSRSKGDLNPRLAGWGGGGGQNLPLPFFANSKIGACINYEPYVNKQVEYRDPPPIALVGLYVGVA